MQHGHFQRPLEIPAAHLEDLYIRRPKTLWVVVAACALSVMIRNTCALVFLEKTPTVAKLQHEVRLQQKYRGLWHECGVSAHVHAEPKRHALQFLIPLTWM